ncbi:MAG: outer membrane protein assembly factor BamA, partial [Bdellovibrionota bacterium]
MNLFIQRFQHPAFMGFLLVCAALGVSPLAYAKPSKGLRKGSLVPSVSVHSAMSEFEGKRIIKIEVKGLKRIEKEAVLAKLVSKTGEHLRSENVREDIQKIYGMGFFDDVDFQADVVESGLVEVTILVRERPVISKIEFDGNERITSSDLKDVIKLKEWAIFDVNKVREDTALIQKHYEEKGFYLAKVSFSVKLGKAGEVELTYKVNDYEKVQIKKITFLNNKAFTEEQLKGILQETREGGLFSFMSGSGSFKESSFKNDMQRLTYWYLDHGFIKFRYENPVVTVSDDKRWLYISIYVEEGSPYSMGSVDFGGDLLFSKEELQGDLTLTGSQLFSISKRNADIQKLSEKYQDLGYAFVNVIPKMNMHDDTRVVDISYEFEKGNLVYFGEINVVGNSKTYDKVIRRELKIHEGELYSGTQLRISRENVERLGYFAPGEVLFNTTTPKGKQDVL